MILYEYEFWRAGLIVYMNSNLIIINEMGFLLKKTRFSLIRSAQGNFSRHHYCIALRMRTQRRSPREHREWFYHRDTEKTEVRIRIDAKTPGYPHFL